MYGIEVHRFGGEDQRGGDGKDDKEVSRIGELGLAIGVRSAANKEDPSRSGPS